VSSAPQHGTPAGDAFLALSKFARATGQDSQDVFTMYALEGLLSRLAASPFCEDFVLKGGVLLAAFSARRPTKDIDLRASGLDDTADAVADRFREILTIQLDDGLVFLPDTIKASVIREDEEYEGIRLRLQASLGKTRLFVGVDVNFGDPVWPAPQTVVVPPLAGLRQMPVELSGYPLSMVIAEKIVTMVQRGPANTRWRDFADVYTLQRLHAFEASTLRQSMMTTADYRGVVLTPLLGMLADMADRAQARWAAWRVRGQRHDLPEVFAEVLKLVEAFADPVLDGTVGDQTWHPEDQTWG